MIGFRKGCTVFLSLVSIASSSLFARGPPNNATGVKTITSPAGATVRYKEPGKDGVCETTSDVNSYSGYVDLDANVHMFFWFFEARHDPANAPLTLWLNGGPGSDSLIGLFQGESRP
jgi:carboxypeptidase C (cathepsin A)